MPVMHIMPWHTLFDSEKIFQSEGHLSFEPFAYQPCLIPELFTFESIEGSPTIVKPSRIQKFALRGANAVRLYEVERNPTTLVHTLSHEWKTKVMQGVTQYVSAMNASEFLARDPQELAVKYFRAEPIARKLDKEVLAEENVKYWKRQGEMLERMRPPPQNDPFWHTPYHAPLGATL